MAKSAETQLRILVDMGYSLEDAQQSINWVTRNLPPETSFNTWVPSSLKLDDMPDQEAAKDAKTNWYQTAPDKYKRILDATPNG